MAVSQIINVIVNSRGAVTVRRELEAMGDSARTTTTYLNGLRAVLAAALTFTGAGMITEVADNFTVLQNRLRQVADENNTVADSWERLMTIANSSYSTIDNTVNLYFRVAQAYKAWGESAEEAYEFTELFQKAAVLSGSSVQTTSQAVYQFSQALNKGKLDGDEFRSVLEGLPYVASLIQNSLGVTRAELYEMSAAGQISVDRIKEAFESAADTIRGDWANITPTIGMALIVLKNNWTDFVGEVQTSTGIFSAFAYLILGIANNFELLALAMAPVVTALVFMGGRLAVGLVVIAFQDMYTAIRQLIPVLWALNAAMLANPYVLAAAAIAAVVAAVVYFRNEIGLTNELFASLWAVVTEFFSYLWTQLMAVVNYIAQSVAALYDWQGAFDSVQRSVQKVWNTIVSMFNALVSAVSSTAAYLKKTLEPLFESLMDLARAYIELQIEMARLYGEVFVAAIELVLEVFKALWKYVEPALKELIAFTVEVLRGWQNIAKWLGENFLPVVKDVFGGWINILKTVIDTVKYLIDLLKTALSLMSQTGGAAGGGGGGPGANYGMQGYAGEFANGGQFNVGGTGAGRDTTPVAFRANRGERVTVETKKQQRQNDGATTQAPSVNVPLSVINIMDPSMVPQAMESVSGRRAFLNLMASERDDVLSILGVY